MQAHTVRSAAYLLVLTLGACSAPDAPDSQSGERAVGSLAVSLTLPEAVEVDSLEYAITGPESFQRSGSVPLRKSVDASFRIQLADLPAATNYQLRLESTDKTLHCRGGARFDVEPSALTGVSVNVRCGPGADNGESLVAAALVERCTPLEGVAAISDVGDRSLSLHAWTADERAVDPASYHWQASAGTIDARGDAATLHCPPGGGAVAVHVQLGPDACGGGLELDQMCPVDWSHTAHGTSQRLYGVTIDSIADVDATVSALHSLARKPTARVVFDPGVSASEYAAAVARIHEVSSVMGELVDSRAVAQTSLDEYTARAHDYLDTLGENVDIWEIGNEINGEWLGKSEDVVAKALSAYRVAHDQHKQTALTLYYNPSCWESADHEMFRWIEEQLPYELRSGPDYVLLSFYEDHCLGARPDWNSVFTRLAQLFPNAKLGFGECGTTLAAKKVGLIEHYYSLDVPLPQYVGGYFWWYFRQDMVRPSSVLLSVLNSALEH